jgi:hypothetical protein
MNWRLINMANTGMGKVKFVKYTDTASGGAGCEIDIQPSSAKWRLAQLTTYHNDNAAARTIVLNITNGTDSCQITSYSVAHSTYSHPINPTNPDISMPLGEEAYINIVASAIADTKVLTVWVLYEEYNDY